MRSSRRRVRTVVAIVALVAASLPSTAVVAQDNPSTTVFVNEIHYDNDGTDSGELIEVAGPAGTDLTGWSVVLYNGSNGADYGATTLTDVIADDGSGYGTVVITYPSNGLQNGSPDGIALVDDSGSVVQFLSYEGTLTGVDGPAAGVQSTDIGVAEGSSTPAGSSLQLTGTGTAYGDFTWHSAASTPGAANAGQTFGSGDPGPTTTAFINEFHYDNAGADADEFVEVAGPAGTELAGWAVVGYNGSSGAPYETIDLSGTVDDEGNGYGAVSFPFPGLQNGSPDGIALVDAGGDVVEFLSYEGSFTAAGGPADGMESTDVGVTEESDSPEGAALGLTGPGVTPDGMTWGPVAASAGCVNPGQPDLGPSTCGEEPAPAGVFVNELHYDNAGADMGEAVELAGPAGADLTGWTVALYNGSNGTVYGTISLDGTVDDEGNGYGAVSFPFEGIQNGSPDGLALVDAEGAVVEFLSYEGVITATGGPAAGMTSVDIGVSEPTDAPADESVQRTGPGTEAGDFTWTNAAQSFGCLNAGQSDIAGSCGSPAPVATLISAVQGSGDVSPLEGVAVVIEGVVVGDFEGPSPNLRGFYVQEEDADHDGDPSTSEAVFVFHGDEDTVSVGDLVRVTGTVAEFQGQTQLGFPDSVEIIGSGSVTPTPVAMPFPTADHLERYEGMSVVFPEPLYVTEFFQLGRFGQVVASSGGRLQQPTAVADPGAPAMAVQAANDLNRIILDDRTNDQNPDPITLARNGIDLSASNTLRGGDTVTGATGILTYTWAGNAASGNAYRLRPAADGDRFMFEAVNERPASAPSVGGSLTVTSFNVLNYFLTLDQGGNQCGAVPQDCRGAEDAEEFERQRTKLLAALERIDADVLGLVELENTPSVSPEADLAGGLGDYAAVDAGTVGDDVIRVGIIYKPATVTPIGEPQILDYGDGRNRASLAQTFADNATGEVFSVVVNHLKSKGCDEASGADLDQGDGQGCWNATRTAAAQTLVTWLATDPTGVDDDDWLVMGDLNVYDHEDPVTVLEAAGYADLGKTFGGEEAYSYVFDGQWGYLDYALASPSMLGQVTGAAEYHINSNEPSVLDYNTNFKSPGQVVSLYAPDEFRTSDHDPIVVGLGLDGGINPKLRANPSLLLSIFPTYRTVTVGSRGADVSIVGVTSSEADSGLGPFDQPNDIVVLGDTKLKLRAESYSWRGRTYTIAALVSDDGQAAVDTAEVRAFSLLSVITGHTALRLD